MTPSHRAARLNPEGSASDRGKAGLLVGPICVVWFVGMLVATTSGFNWLSTWHNEQRAVQVVLLAMTALLAPSCARPFLRDVRFPGRSGGLTCFLALGLISAGAASLPVHSLAEIALLGALIGLVVVVWFAASQLPTRFVSLAAIGLAAAHITGVLTRYLTAVFLGQPLGVDVLLLGYANPRFPSAFYSLLIPFLAFAACKTDERRSIRAVAFVVLCTLWTVNLALGTRAIFFAYVVAVPIFVAFIGAKRARTMLWALATSFILGLLLYWLMFILVPFWAGLSAADLMRGQADLSGTSGRLSLWQAATSLIVAHPILGVGPMHFASVSHPHGAHPHNSIFQLASEYGVPATLMLGYIVWKLFHTSARAIRRNDPNAARACVPAFLALIVAAIYSLVDGNYLMPVSQSAIAICVGVLLAGTFPLSAALPETLNSSPWPSRLAGVVIATSGIYLSAYAVATIGDGTPASGAYSLPRFWEQGFIGRAVANKLQ